MSIPFRASNSKATEYMLKQEHLILHVKVLGNAVPASKTLTDSAPGFAYLRCEGITAAADAVEDCSSQVSFAAADSSGRFSVLVDEVKIKELINAEVIVLGSGTCTIASKLTTGGRILMDLDSSLDLSGANTADLQLKVSYIRQ